MKTVKYLICLVLPLALSACASEKEIPERGLEYYEVGYSGSWPYPNANIRRVYSDDTVFYQNYFRGDDREPEVLNSEIIVGSFAQAAQVFNENGFDEIEPICKVDTKMIHPSDIQYSHITTNIGGDFIIVVGGCRDGFSLKPEKQEAFDDITAAITELVGLADN